ncbi:ATP-binding protein [Marinicella gelatinilytica]|uniref:ATP-binding protein n=1 Tax=Marinicella gelatinilytica TaxID=2996017 RepID=UPI002260DF62|nr:ATP-binding protein [Marinicella gelatinilytica]MCX7545923.1 ATP-binding protein [Marinicella gelatinilytica]
MTANILKNKDLGLFVTTLLMTLMAFFATHQWLWSLLIVNVVVLAGFLFRLPVIFNRYDNQFSHQVDWIIPVVAASFLGLSFWFVNNVNESVMVSLWLVWVMAIVLFKQLQPKEMALITAIPALSLLALFIFLPGPEMHVTQPFMFALVLVLTTLAMLAAKLFLFDVAVAEEKKAEPLPDSIAKQIKRAEEARKQSQKLKEDIKDLKVKLSAAEMAKMEFLATMSHEIRTPLNGIVPLLDIVMDTELNDFQKDYLSTAHTSATQMQKLIDDLLDYSKVEAGKLTIEVTALKVRKVIEEVLDNLSASAERKGLEIETRIDDQISPLLRGDPIRLRQVLTNLLSNAIKFSDRGKITVEAKKVKNFASKELIRFVIKDEGIGISEDQQDKLFNAFTQGDNSSTRKFGGTGLGLTISQKIVDLLKGKMGVDSKKGLGSSFWFEIPFSKSVTDSGHQQSEISQHQAILINTNPVLFKRLSADLEHALVKVQSSLNYQHAMSRIQATRGIQDKKTTLLFIDFDTNAKTLRQILTLVEKGEFNDVWICVITKGEHIAGIKQYKNIQVIKAEQDIEMIIREFERRFYPDQVQSTETIPFNNQEDSVIAEEVAIEPKKLTRQKLDQISKTVLLVEDNEVNLKVAQKLIDYIGFPFDVAENGMEALNKAKNTRYRLILMDCQMPVMDGYHSTRRIRRYEEENNLDRTPIIAMTANAMLGDKEKCLEAGMDDYMSKPLNRYLLEKTLKKWDPFANSESVKANQPTKTDAALNNINPKWLNVKALAEIKEFMGEETDDLLNLFQQETPAMMEKLKTLKVNGDFEEVRHIAHTLKSTGANIGATGFSHFCKKMEAAAIEKNAELMKDCISKVIKSYQLTIAEIKKYQNHSMASN